jgi:hypothetical protein
MTILALGRVSKGKNILDAPRRGKYVITCLSRTFQITYKPASRDGRGEGGPHGQEYVDKLLVEWNRRWIPLPELPLVPVGIDGWPIAGLIQRRHLRLG